jgi:hypothetical protein
MSEIEVGDEVIYINHCTFTSIIFSADKRNFKIGKVYEIERVREDAIYFKGNAGQVLLDQVIKPLINNKLNKVLYPDYIEYGKYLIPKETYEIIAHKEK